MIEEDIAKEFTRFSLEKSDLVLDFIDQNRELAVFIFGRPAVENFEKLVRRSLSKQAAAVEVLEAGGSLREAAAAAKEASDE